MTDLIDLMREKKEREHRADRYPRQPGYREGDTSRAAAEEVAKGARALRGRVLRSLTEQGPASVHEMAERLGLPISSVQPRFSELRAMELIFATGNKVTNPTSGKKAHVWAAR